MQFRDIAGNEGLKKVLIGNAKADRISHAQLFLGEEGSGNLPLSLAFAQYIFCQQPGEDDSCGTCGNCRKVSNMAHPDLHFTFPFFSSREARLCKELLPQWRQAFAENPYLSTSSWFEVLGGENKQGIINKEEGLDTLQRLNLKSYEGGYKINILWMPELLHPSAANALLKIIEEPPHKTLFFLVGSKADEILPTILSRAQLVKVNRLPVDELGEELMSRHGLDRKMAFSVAATSEGNYGDALQEISGRPEEFSLAMFTNWMRICYKTNVQEAVQWVEEIAKIGREKQKQFIRYCLFISRQCILKHYLGDDRLTVRGEELDFVKRFSPFINERNILDFTRHFDDAYRDITRNANPKILFMDLTFKAFVLLKK